MVYKISVQVVYDVYSSRCIMEKVDVEVTQAKMNRSAKREDRIVISYVMSGMVLFELKCYYLISARNGEWPCLVHPKLVSETMGESENWAAYGFDEKTIYKRDDQLPFMCGYMKKVDFPNRLIFIKYIQIPEN